MMAPSSLYCLMPVLNATTGIPASFAAAIESFSVSGDSSVTAMPSTLLSTAFWIRVASPGAVGSLEYLRSMLSLAAATCAPARTLSQNESPGASWVTIAMVNLGVSATAPPPPPGVGAGSRGRGRFGRLLATGGAAGRERQRRGHGDRGQPQGLRANRHRFESFPCGTGHPMFRTVVVRGVAHVAWCEVRGAGRDGCRELAELAGDHGTGESRAVRAPAASPEMACGGSHIAPSCDRGAEREIFRVDLGLQCGIHRLEVDPEIDSADTRGVVADRARDCHPRSRIGPPACRAPHESGAEPMIRLPASPLAPMQSSVPGRSYRLRDKSGACHT